MKKVLMQRSAGRKGVTLIRKLGVKEIDHGVTSD